MHKVELFHTEGCHLCEMAFVMLSTKLPVENLIQRDIIDDATLMSLYQIRIPVVKRIRDGQELGWPFNDEQLEEFLAQA
jgi:hypothetical protein